MSIYKMVKENLPNAKNKSEAVMWTSLKRLSDILDPMMEAHPDIYWELKRGMYEDMMGPHYNEKFAEWQVKQMWYIDKQGKTHKGGHWSLEESEEVYNRIKGELPSTNNKYDWYVTLSMIWADNSCLYKKWWPDASESDIEEKVEEAAVNWLSDDDAEDGHIWNYFK